MEHFSAPTLWLIVAGVLVIIELLTGTFYLLMMGMGAVAGAMAAYFGASVTLQLASASLLGGGAVALWHAHMRRQQASEQPASRNRDVNLDIGERVHVTAWEPDGTTRVQYRGSGWQARLAPGAQPQSGQHFVVAVEGNWLVLMPSGA